MTMTLERALDVLRVVTSRAMQGSETRDAYDCVVSHLTQTAQSVAAKDAEIERLSQESAQQFIRARDWAELSGKNEDRASLAESRLAAANALLRFVRTRFDACMDDSDRASIDAHLSENTHDHA